MVVCQEGDCHRSRSKFTLNPETGSFDERTEVIQVQKLRETNFAWKRAAATNFNVHITLDGIWQKIDALPENLEVGSVCLEFPPSPPTRRAHTTFPTLDRIHNRS